MSRSKHTDPLAIRAKRRVQSPRDGRGVGDLSHRQRLGRLFKEMGVAPMSGDTGARLDQLQPRITIHRPRPGFLHPAKRSDVFRVLEFVGPEAIYGVQRIEFSRATDGDGPAHVMMGRFEAPGMITLYEQPIPPWRLTGALAKCDAILFQRAGATVEFREENAATTISWPGDTLRDFMLFEVLLHEIGHHILQHNKGKRTKQIVRTGDHEAFAGRFAQEHRTAWFDHEVSLK